MTNELTGRVAIVTGGASGIGRTTVDAFVAEGARVVIADINGELGATVAAEYGPEVAFQRTDVSDAAQVAELVAVTVARFGGLDIMLNNAGIPTTMRAGLLDEPLDDFHRLMAVDLLGVMLGTQHAARYMAGHGGGSIINTTSIGGIRAGRGEPVYRAAKAGVIHFTKCAAIDLAEYGIRVNSIAPGAIPTPILASTLGHLDDIESATLRLREVMRSIRPLPREGSPSDIAAATVFYAGERSAYITGTVLPVDGGIVAGHAGNAFAEIEAEQAEPLSA
ncbi:SDR family NAD(P)-dependent oxidoreductase [Nocardia sp. BMG111209]|uniref:SDR family NAD(P)-dependent oxidoreductase n=1 Tax=Nocardia sp. BMG111209 TaxID=1160137 RepID=UPI00037EC5AE|nr:SDR family oxidoreductase [Nocardia sp. BMG111209]